MRPSPATLVVAALGLCAVAACASSKAPAPPPRETTPPPETTPPAPAETLPPEDEQAGPSREVVVKGFIADCHAAFPIEESPATDEEPAKMTPECEVRFDEQDCSGGYRRADILHCGDVYQRCYAACIPTCNACQERCGGTCDGCKAACAPGDAACVRGCAEARASCRDSCDEASTHCRYTECGAASTACWEPIDRTSQECDKDACNGWSKCRKSGSEAKCQTKFPELSDFCRQSCRAEGWGLIDRLDAAQQKLDEETYQAQVDDGLVDYLGEPDDELAGHCTPAAHCPADYAIASRFLGLFCDNSLSDAGLGLLQKAVAEKKVGKAGLEVIFNAYGAFYGYTFTQKTWLNDFFYAHGAWLPANCEGNMKRFASEREMGGMYMRARDRVKRIWSALH